MYLNPKYGTKIANKRIYIKLNKELPRGDRKTIKVIKGVKEQKE